MYTEHQIRNLGTIKTEYPEHANVRNVRIAHLYVKIYVLISHCFDICGVHDMTVCYFSLKKNTENHFLMFYILNSCLCFVVSLQDLIRFDGAIFHRNMEKFEMASEQCMKVLESAIEPIWIFSE